ncbi:MAG: hypothetical protein OXH71_02640 [Candidatus Dadabacteria bacterium]|nr:hypothetical protein [Candidatus Dadabacteria bacterium]MDE0519576.1 hypothetical protein [Candidatus Dadabacteria bacterium]MDE0663504.1 hypothetical protein [Candidatus Dadabacteria bacterium]
MRKEALFFIAFSLIFLVSSCSATRFLMNYASGDDRKTGKMKDWVYTTDLNSYRVAPLSRDWERIPLEGGDMAFYNPKSDLVLTVSSLCADRDYDLQTLSDSLVVGLGKKRVRLRKDIEIDGAAGLYTEYEASLGDDSFSLATVVHKSPECDYDFSYSAALDGFEANLGEFIDFVSGFEELWAR